MTPDEFVRKWKHVELKERAAAHSHFIDLCRMLDEPAPTDVDPKGDWYAFERGATKTTGGEGWADVWKRDHFGWEYKGKRKDLRAAFAQLQQYALALENPPLLVVCDMDRFEIHTNWTNSVSAVHEFGLDELRDANVRDKLKSVFSDPERLRPGKTRQALTEEAAAEFAKLAQRLRDRGNAAETVAHFINRLVFCMFAEDVDLLPNKMFKRMLEHAASRPEEFHALASDLFKAMQSGGRVGFEHVAWFNGGLFNDDTALPLDKDDIALALAAAHLDWAEIDPSILGTLFERGLDPDKRSQLGAHYTDREKIMMIVDPVIVRPWLTKWELTKAEIAISLEKSHATKNASVRTKASDQAVATYRAFLNGLRAFRTLDPACGSGNFLYLALLALKDIEHRISIEAEAMGLQREFPQVGPASVKGIEINQYAAELARVSVWIGEIQWMRRNGFGVSDRPILKPLDNIECRDAILNNDGTEAVWPEADVVIGNPPFLGGKLLRALLGDKYVDQLFAAYDGRVPAEADLVTYWVAKAWETILSRRLNRAGLVTTNSIRGGANRKVLEPIAAKGFIFDAWDDEAWVVDGAAVRVSVICFVLAGGAETARLNGIAVPQINADLTGTVLDLTKAVRLSENRNVAFMGDTKGGSFDVEGDLAREWLALPLNPNGRLNAEVLRPWMNGMDVTRRAAGKWIIDFGWSMSESEAALFEAPFAHVFAKVKPERDKNNREAYRRNWWRHVEPRPGMWKALRDLKRFIVTPEVAKHRIFAWMQKPIVPDHKLQVIARDDDVTFGILQSRFHQTWSIAVGSWHGVGNDPRYTIGTCFETFPFPDGLTPTEIAGAVGDVRADAIAAAAKGLNELRENWLNPLDLVRREPEIVPGFPDRLIPINSAALALLKKRTLTNLYNERPTWLANAHADLDAAVAYAYGWPADISEEEALARLFALNQERAARGALI
ncbi:MULTISPECIES: class I SAM-dependent DNA methyltransferase [unclassified Bradyrhizobium]|uniref:class I SAM-dependent DNA methyltransferase n=1 Tax=unclassified Bradyrhizobium TaxID=2631580 RepID=UPI001FF99E3A|nr:MULTISPECIES: class I SAM-dependent DNA methyltransferase [unclassified Bradyrhizobium]MCK1271368.1 class I SAM-dependent DNA methyltransferase [Bradyrhizobium sp. 84]MCK1375687.1 class I SAM-dependent DNA methyltransferase [Bradyrhizobium sp. 49]MCK1427382.1 class I SAM-dependent DNA methyltransferase [Bradyrhizobium sp. 87]